MIGAKKDSGRALKENELEIGTIYRSKSPYHLCGYVRVVYLGKNQKNKHTFCITDFKGGMLATLSKKDIANGDLLIENGYSK